MIRLLAWVATRIAFIALMIIILTVAKTTYFAWAGPIFIATQMVLVVLVRYAWSAYDKWAEDWAAWSRDVEAWAAWHRQYVAWSAERPASRAVAA